MTPINYDYLIQQETVLLIKSSIPSTLQLNYVKDMGVSRVGGRKWEVWSGKWKELEQEARM